MNAVPIMDDATLLDVLDAEHRPALAWLVTVDPALAALVAGFPRWLERAARQLELHPTPWREAAFRAAVRCWVESLRLIVDIYRDEARP